MLIYSHSALQVTSVAVPGFFVNHFVMFRHLGNVSTGLPFYPCLLEYSGVRQNMYNPSISNSGPCFFKYQHRPL